MTGRPHVSVVVPVYNDPAGVGETLDALVAQTYPRDRHEVLAVDNGSTDDTRAVIREFAADHDHVHLVVEDEVQGAYAARNAGIERATGEVLAFLDADVTVPDGWLADAVAAMEDRGADYLGCEVALSAPEGPDSAATRYDRRTGFPIQRYVEEFGFAPTCGLLVRRSVVADVGPFDPRLVSGGDVEFGNRVRDAGRDLHYAPDVPVTHPTRTTVRALAAKAARVGRGRYQLRAYYPGRYGHPLALLCNPLTYLPPLPWLAPATVRGFGDLPAAEQVAMYLLLCVTKFARSYGKLRQALAMGLAPFGGAAGPRRPWPGGDATRAADRPEESD